jgi:hypothetical protein
MEFIEQLKELSELIRTDEDSIIDEITSDRLLFKEAKASLSELIQQLIYLADNLNPIEENDEARIVDFRG